MKQTSITQRLRCLGGTKWTVHVLAKERARLGHPVLTMTIGEPDIPTPAELIEDTYRSMLAGRTGYSNGSGEPGLREALAHQYSSRLCMPISAQQFICFPGAQSALFAVILGMLEAGDEILIANPMYATYESVVRSSGAEIVTVPLRIEDGFRLNSDEIRARITPRTKALLLNNPHNPTGAVLGKEQLSELCHLALKHDFWIISDEVYEELVFTGHSFHSPYPFAPDRVIVISSISKSHAAPGFRSGWCMASENVIETLLPLAETMLFGNQPFIADMTQRALQRGSLVADGMKARFQRRATWLYETLESQTSLKVHRPAAGMFALVDIRSTGMDSDIYARDLLLKADVAVMPGSAFGDALQGWVRVALTISDEDFRTACGRIVSHAQALNGTIS